MAEHDPALVLAYLRCADQHPERHDQGGVGTCAACTSWGEHAAAAVAPAIWEAAQREHRIEWAGYIANWGSAVGPESPTVWSIVEALRAESLPFGRSAGDMAAQQREEQC